MINLVGDARHLSPSAQEALRLRAVAALAAGRDREDVAELLRVLLEAVDVWWAKWLAGCREALVMRPRGKPDGVHQVLDEAERAVLDHRPCVVGLSSHLWRRRLVGELIAKLYRVRLAEPGAGKYLKRWRLSFQRPNKRAVEQDPQAVQRWHEETWPKARTRAKKDGGEILFADQVTVRSDQIAGLTWGEEDRTPVLRRNGNRFSANAMSAISTKDRMHFMVFTESFTAEVMCRFPTAPRRFATGTPPTPTRLSCTFCRRTRPSSTLMNWSM
ncbi:hypothetical protein GCM10010449_50280 [Streptomyces rectiviolaceus]|uniref:Winged helix-turn helix domain-containing protein n=1 Tax=Streptomyces rectiviolaceus TaxID=332591 RepID=A0ABP6MQB7_9ACTN